MLGAATPALAKPGNGKGHAYGHSTTKPAKPEPKAPKSPKAKKTKSGVSGGGAVSGGEFSVQARLRSLDKGHFNYTSTDGLFKVRCHDGFQTFTPVIGQTERSASVTFNNCRVTGQAQAMQITVAVIDRGQPSVTPPVADEMSFTVPTVPPTTYGGVLTDGNVKVR
jgi:hypothetical protein